MRETIQLHRTKFKVLASFLLMYSFITLLAGYGLGDANGVNIALVGLVPLGVGAALAYLCATTVEPDPASQGA